MVLSFVNSLSIIVLIIFFVPLISTHFNRMRKGSPRLDIDNNAGDSGRWTYGLYVLYVVLH
jgi:fumarate reductase subunit D